MNKIQHIISKNINYLLITIVLLWLFRGYEYFTIEFVGETSPKLSYFNSGLLFDVFSCFSLFGFSILLQFVLSFLSIKKQIVFPFLSVLFLVLTAGLIYYFKISKSPLDETIYSFTWEEIKIISSGAKENTYSIIVMIIILLTFYFTASYFLKRIILGKKVALVLGIIALLSLLFSPFVFYPSEKRTKEVFVNNRLVYFLGRSILHFSEKGDNMLFINDIKKEDFGSLTDDIFPREKLNDDYPLLHIQNQSSSLAPKLNKTKKGYPNIVFIIVEGLCSDFIGKYAKSTGNCMPFLDSLSKKSLYFPNFLTTCQRTFNVLPASLSSVPNSTDGMFTTNNAFTPQISLPLLLNNTHFTRFYCGVDLSYGNMNGYMGNLNTRYLVENWASKYKKPFTKKFNFWGYPDDYLFQKSWDDYEKQGLNKKPRFDVFLTISTHEPYVFPKENEYIAKVQKSIKNLRLSSSVKRQLFKDPLFMASYSYADEALKTYFKKVQKLPEFENTIFVIYGDHGSPNYSRTPISRFNIPLVIYSPLLKKPEKIEAVNSQLDLAPTFINYLKKEYHFKFPRESTFIGNELDMNTKFSCNRTMALLSLNGKNESFLHKKYVFLHDQLYKLHSGFKLTPVHSSAKANFYKNQLNYYDIFSKYCFNNRIVPENLYSGLIKTNAIIKNRYYAGDFKYWKHIYQEKQIEQKEKYIFFGKASKLESNVRRYRLICEVDYFLKTKKDFGTIPKIVSSLENIKQPSNELIFWQVAEPVLINNFKPNAYNKVIYYLDVNIPRCKQISKNNKLDYYIFNENLFKLKFNKVKAVFYTVGKKAN